MILRNFRWLTVSRIVIILSVIIILSPLSYGQSGYTQVTATVVDTNGSKYANAPYTVVFFDPGTSGKLPLLSGSTFQKSYNGYATDGNGNISISLPDNNIIASTSGATGTQWVFNICTAVGAYTTQFCIQSVSITISGNSQNISSVLTPLAPLLPILTPIQLQTNSVNNTTQTTLNLKNGSNVTLTSDALGGVTINSTGGGGGGGSPGGVTSNVQYNNASTFAGAAGITTDGSSLTIKGMSPWADLTAFARALPSFGCSPLARATINLGTPTQATLTSSTCFQNGDGITIIGAGAANGLTTPTLTTVTPASISVGGTALGGGTGTPINVVSGVGGSSTYSYTLIGRDKFGGYTPASAPVSTTTGLASLGVFTCTISTITRSGLTWTVTFTAACEGAVQGANMVITGVTGGEGFGGYYNIKTVNSSSQVTVIGSHNSAAFGWNIFDQQTNPNSGTGGTASFFGSNHLQWSYNAGTWYYYICAKRPGDANYHLIGRTMPSSTVYEDIQFDDYGSPFNDSQKYPSYIEVSTDTPNSNDAICINGSGLPDPLTTTVLSGGGTSTITLTNPASTAVVTSPALIDDGPGLVAAANSAVATVSAGNVYIPPVSNAGNPWFLINSYTKLPSNLVVHGAGTIIVNETIEEPSSVTWDGGWGSASGLQFSYFSNGGENIWYGPAYPIFYISPSAAGVHNSNITFLPLSNFNGQLVYVIDGSNVNFDNIQFDLSTGTNDNYLAQAIVFRGTGLSNPSVLDINRSLFLASTMTATLPTETPYIYTPASQTSGTGACAGLQGGSVSLTNVSLYQRGFIQTTCNGGGENWYLKNVVRQSGFVPLLSLFSGSSRAISQVVLDNVTIDTGEGQYVATGNQAGNPTLITLNIMSRNLQGTGQFTGSTDYFDQYNFATGTIPNSAGDSHNCEQGQGIINGVVASVLVPMNCNFDANAIIGPNAEVFSPQLVVPTGVTGTAVAGGSLGSGTFEVFVTANDIAGRSGMVSAPSANVTTSVTCPGSGNCSISVGWTGVVGQGTSAIWACQVGASTVMPQCPTISNMTSAINVTTNPFTLSSVAGGSGAFQPSLFTLAGISGFSPSFLWAPIVGLDESSAPTCVPNYDLLYGDSATHRARMCNNNGSTDSILGAATTDTLTGKSYDTAGSGNVLKINGNQVSSVSGNTAKVQLESGATTTNDAAKFDANGNIVDAGLIGTLNVCPIVQIALTTGAIASGARATNTGTCTGLSTSTDTVNCSFNSDTNAVTGYAPSASGGLSLKIWISTNTINVDQVNNTSGSITPGAATVNCKGIR